MFSLFSFKFFILFILHQFIFWQNYIVLSIWGHVLFTHSQQNLVDMIANLAEEEAESYVYELFHG